MKKTSLKDLARHLGLSQTTVSRGLANYPEVTDATKARIRKVAAELNYAPSSSAQKLALGRSFAIGHVIAQSAHQTINPFYADFIAGTGETYAAHGYDMLLSMTTKEEELETYRNLVNAQKVDGFIISEPVPNDARISLLQNLSVPFVVHGRLQEEDAKAGDYVWLDVNNAQGFETGTSYLLSLGHRDIALINGPEAFNFAIQRHRGFTKAMSDNGVQVRSDWLISESMTEQSGFAVAFDLLGRADRPTAIICSSFFSALGIQRAASHHGLQLGKDLSVICWDDCLSGFHIDNASPQFTALQSSIYHAGQQIAEMLIQLIKAPNAVMPSTLLEAKLVIGQSTASITETRPST